VAQVIVPDYQLSLAIGKEGQNARLAARLTGWKIDIRPDTPGDGSAVPAATSGAPAGGSRRGAGRAAGSAGGSGVTGTLPGAADAPAL
jgi:N utilization substance protein A